MCNRTPVFRSWALCLDAVILIIQNKQPGSLIHVYSIKSSSDSSRIFFVAFATSLSVALFNGYPLLFPDSYSYLGFDPNAASHGYRQVTLEFLARPLYPLLGAWSVVVIQTAVLSYLIALFSSMYLSRVKALEWAVLMIISQLPFYAAFLMADIWLVIFVLAYLLLLKEFRWPPFLILAIAITVHGSHFYIFIASAMLAFEMFTNRAHIARISVAAILLAIIFTGFVNGLLGHDKNKELSWTLVGSKILVQIPDAISQKCNEDADFLLCPHRENIEAGASSWCEDLPDCHVWKKQSFFHDIEHSELKAASKELFIFTLLNKPVAFIQATVIDSLQFQRFECSGDLGPLPPAEPGIEPALSGAPMHPHGVMLSNPAYERTMQAANAWSKAPICSTLVKFKTLTYILGAIALVLLWFFGSRTATRTALFCVAVLVINDLFFAALSGAYLRYHDRGLFLLMIPALLAINEFRARREKQ